MKESDSGVLLEKARQRDPASLSTLCTRFYPKVLKYMTYRVNVDVAEDLTGEVFVKVIRNIDRQSGSFVAWLYRIAENVVIDFFRAKGARSETAMDDRIEQTVTNGATPHDGVDARLDLQDAVGHLSDDQRQLVTLKFIQGLSNSQIAQIMERSTGAIRVLQFRALSALRDLLGAKEVRHEA